MLALHSLALLVAAAAAPAGPAITQVVVYPDRAQVTRRASLSCGSGATARFEALPPATDPASLRASTSVGVVVGLRVEQTALADAYSKARESDEVRLRDLLAQDAALVDALTRVQESDRLTAAYGQVTTSALAREAISAPPMNTAAWQSALDLGVSTRLKSAGQRVELNAQRRTLAEKIDDVRLSLARTEQAAAKSQTNAEVSVACPAGSLATIELTYRVGGAGWSPAYEARADFEQGTVDLAAFATVRQTTGEAWSQAQLILSTAVPTSEATPPELQPLRIAAEERAPEQKVLVRREEVHEHAEATKSGGKDNLPTSTPVASSGEALSAHAQGLSVQLTVPEPADVAGDGTEARVFIGRARLASSFAFRTAPQLQPFVFRVADLTNTAPFPLLAGPVDAFGRAGFLGRYPVTRVAEGETFHLTFGIDDSLKVRRVVLEEVQRDTGLFNGHRRFRYGYRLELANFSGAPREVELLEPFPVSELDDVTVAIDETTAPGFEKRSADGIAAWKMKLASGQTTALELHFHVDVPSSYDLGQL